MDAGHLTPAPALEDPGCQEAEAVLRLLAGVQEPVNFEMRQLLGPLMDQREASPTPEAAAQRAEVRYRVLVEQIPAITFMAALDQGLNEMYAYVSPQIEKILGYTQKEWLEDPVLWYSLFTRTIASAVRQRDVSPRWPHVYGTRS